MLIKRILKQKISQIQHLKVVLNKNTKLNINKTSIHNFATSNISEKETEIKSCK